MTWLKVEGSVVLEYRRWTVECLGLSRIRMTDVTSSHFWLWSSATPGYISAHESRTECAEVAPIHMQHMHKYLEIVFCPYCGDALAKMPTPCSYALVDHRGACGESLGPQPDREALKHHLEEDLLVGAACSLWWSCSPHPISMSNSNWTCTSRLKVRLGGSPISVLKETQKTDKDSQRFGHRMPVLHTCNLMP